MVQAAPMRFNVVLGLGLSLGAACAPVPAQAPQPVAGESTPEPDDSRSTENGVCTAVDADLCSAACLDSECLEWCGGTACIAALERTLACALEVEEVAIAAAGPEPEVVMCGQDCSDEQYARYEKQQLAYDEWFIDRQERLDQGWDARCREGCAVRFEGETQTLCSWDDERVSDWSAVAPPEPERPDSQASHRADLDRQIAQNTGVLGGSILGSFGSWVDLATEQPSEMDHRFEIAAMIRHQSGTLGLDGCASQDGETNGLVLLTFGAGGGVSEAEPQLGNAGEQCLAQRVEALRLPPRVAAELGPVVVDIRASAGLLGESFGGSIDATLFGGSVDDALMDAADVCERGSCDMEDDMPRTGGTGEALRGSGGGGTAEGLGGLRPKASGGSSSAGAD